MCCSSQGCPSFNLVKLVVSGLLLNSTILSSQLGLAADSSLLPVVPQPVQWLSGPVDAALSGVAEIHVPAGFRFTDAKGARTLLESTRTPIPQNLAGLMTSVSGEWWITFEYSDYGHVSTTDQNNLNQEALLKAFWSQTATERKALGQPALSHVNWEIHPSYHAARQYLDYAVRMEGFSAQDQKITYVARFLGRRGVLLAKSVRPWREGEDAAVFREPLKGVSFKDGERYADFQDGDKVASGALSELITADKGSSNPSKSAAQASSRITVLWIALAVISCLGITGIVMIAKKIRGQRASTPASPANSDASPAPVTSPSAQRAPAPNGSRPFKLNVKPKPVVRPVNGNGNGNGNGHSDRNGNNGKRRRMFNYHKFYTEMVLQGPAPVIGEPTINGYNSHNGHEAEPTRNGTSSESGPAVVHAHSELIASQKSLIEEQKRLIHEQARLIEEKSKLISEKNQLLDRQSQMIDNNLL
jgi:uncharacterized membrane-anchored protein